MKKDKNSDIQIPDSLLYKGKYKFINPGKDLKIHEIFKNYPSLNTLNNLNLLKSNTLQLKDILFENQFLSSLEQESKQKNYTGHLQFL